MLYNAYLKFLYLYIFLIQLVIVKFSSKIFQSTYQLYSVRKHCFLINTLRIAFCLINRILRSNRVSSHVI